MTRHLRPIPDGILTWLLGLTGALTVVTALANFGHGDELATYAGQGRRQAFLAACVADVLITVAVTVLTFRPRNVWAACALISGIAFIGWAAFVTALPGFCATPGEGVCRAHAASATTRVLVAAWPLLAAVEVAGVMASLLHNRHPAGVTLADTPDLKAAPKKRAPSRPPAVKPQTTTPTTPANAPQMTPPQPSVTPSTNTPTPALTDAQAARSATATNLIREGTKRADAVRTVMAQYGVSQSTAERDVDTARKALTAPVVT